MKKSNEANFSEILVIFIFMCGLVIEMLEKMAS